jgi:hypothetical protein
MDILYHIIHIIPKNLKDFIVTVSVGKHNHLPGHSPPRKCHTILTARKFLTGMLWCIFIIIKE